MATFTVLSLDVWGHGPDHAAWGCDGNCDGWTVNDAFRAGTVELSDEPKSAEIIKALVDGAYLTPDCTDESIEADTSDGDFWEINRKEDGKYLLQLTRDE